MGHKIEFSRVLDATVNCRRIEMFRPNDYDGKDAPMMPMSPRSPRTLSGVRSWARNRSGGYQKLPQKKVHPDYSHAVERKPKQWYQKTFERVRKYVLKSDRKARRQTFWQKYQLYFFIMFFAALWSLCYYFRYGIPFIDDFSMSDLQSFIPKKHRKNQPASAADEPISEEPFETFEEPAHPASKARNRRRRSDVSSENGYTNHKRSAEYRNYFGKKSSEKTP